MIQSITSANTSVNSIKVPALFKRIKNWAPNTINLDYGGGKYDTATKYLKDLKIKNCIYDPFNRSQKDNQQTLNKAPFDSATVSNVLNVIKEPEIRKEVIQEALNLLKQNALLYITIYEGNKSGIGRQTSKGWQENRKLKDYLLELKVL